MWVLCECGSIGIPSAGVHSIQTYHRVKGRKLRVRYGDVAVRDLQPESPDAGRGRRRKSHSHVWRVSECEHELTTAPRSPECVTMTPT